MTADIPVPNSNTQSHAQPVILVDKTTGQPYNASGGSGGGDGAILDGFTGTIKATVLDYVNSNPLAVRLTDTGGDYVSVGGGTQYAEDTTQTTAVGNALLWKDASNVLRTPSASKPLPVDIKNSSLAVTGTFYPASQTVAATDLDVRNLVKTQDEVYSVLRTDAGAAYDARDRSWTITETVPVSGTVDESKLTVAIEYSGSNAIYVGWAVPGSAKSAAAWRIIKITYSGSNATDVQYADGVSTFIKVWDSRAGYAYS